MHLQTVARPAPRGHRARRPDRLLQGPGEGLLPRARLHAALGGRRHRRRDLRRHRRPGAVDDRRGMLDDMLRGMWPDLARQAEWRRGSLPPGRLGWRKANELATSPASRVRRPQLSPARPEAYDVDIDLGSGRRLTGTVSPVFGDRLVSVTYSKLDGQHLLESWIPLLALLARDPGGLARGVYRPREEGLHPAGGGARQSRRGPRPRCCANWSRSTTRVVASRSRCPSRRLTRGRSPALRRHPRTSGKYRWKSSDRSPAEDQAPAHVRAWGQGCRLEDLAAAGLDWCTPSRCGCRCCGPSARRDGPFDLLGPLPAEKSTTVLEASAGTARRSRWRVW